MGIAGGYHKTVSQHFGLHIREKRFADLANLQSRDVVGAETVQKLRSIFSGRSNANKIHKRTNDAARLGRRQF